MSDLNTFAARFRDAMPSKRPWRTVGREAELPLVRPDGSAADLAELWPLLAEGTNWEPSFEGPLQVALKGPDFTLSAEVGHGTLEIVGEPRHDLHGMAQLHEDAIAHILRAADRAGVWVLGYGCQPLTPPSEALMVPKQRYGVLQQALGDGWLWFTLTASDQVHVAVARDEALALTNLGNLLAPVTIALCANSPVHSGADAGVCSAREAAMGGILPDTHRHGMPASPFEDWPDLVRRLMQMRLLWERVEGQPRLHHGTLGDWLDAHPQADDEARWAALMLQDHYVWHSARPRAVQGTVELRSACQQPPGSHMAAAALHLGLIAAAPQLAPWLQRVLSNPWRSLRDWHAVVIRDGLAAPEPIPGLLSRVLDHCEQALLERRRGEEVYLAPLRARLDARQNPAQVASQRFAQGGVAALIETVRYR